MTILRDIQGSFVGQLVTLFSIDCTSFDSGTILYFCSTDDNNSAVIFNGISYTPVPIVAEGFEYSGQGAFPTPTLRLSNVSDIASALVILFDDLLGATVTRTRTLRQYLDDGSTPDPLQVFTPDVFQIEQKTRHDNTMIEWKLSAAVDQQGLKVPGFVLVNDYCSRIFRVWDAAANEFNYFKATCRYNGSMYDINNVATAVGADDACPKTVAACKVRFGATAPLQFNGCPGLQKNQ